MEILGFLSGFMIAILVMVVVLQLVYAYALQCLATKNDMSSLAETLAWLPILNVYPFIVSCGGSFPRFLIGSAAYVGGAIGLGFLSSGGGTLSMVAGGLGLLGTLGVLFYFGRLFWGMAERRGLPGFVGLLNFVPVVNFFVFPYIAFHDGFSPVNRVGAALGFLLIAGPAFGQYQLLNMASTTLQAQLSETMEDGALTAMLEQAGSAANAAGSELTQADATAMKTMQLEMRVSMLEALDASDPAHADRMKTQLGEIRQQFEALQGSLAEDRVASLKQAIAAAELRLVGMKDPNLVVAQSGWRSQASPKSLGEPAPMAAVESLGQPLDQSLAQPLTRPSAPPAAPAPHATAEFDPQHGFPVPDTGGMSCEPGTTQQGDAKQLVWCQRDGGGLKHGWSSDRHANGNVAVAGRYRDGLRHGVWSRWYEHGGLRVQAEFDHGLQDGRLVAWDGGGSLTTDLRFEAGELVSR